MLIKEATKVFIIVLDIVLEIVFIIIIALALALVWLGAVISLCHSYSRYSS
ncbi:MAG: hypothetical protein ACI952_002405 [Flavobacteriales bacterium]|jgi:hypothetical protein